MTTRKKIWLAAGLVLALLIFLLVRYGGVLALFYIIAHFFTGA
jgi:hypothetical protein